MAAKHSNLRSAVLPRRAVLRVALTVMVTLVVGLAPGLAQNRAAAVSPYEGYLNFAKISYNWGFGGGLMAERTATESTLCIPADHAGISGFNPDAGARVGGRLK